MGGRNCDFCSDPVPDDVLRWNMAHVGIGGNYLKGLACRECRDHIFSMKEDDLWKLIKINQVTAKLSA